MSNSMIQNKNSLGQLTVPLVIDRVDDEVLLYSNVLRTPVNSLFSSHLEMAAIRNLQAIKIL